MRYPNSIRTPASAARHIMVGIGQEVPASLRQSADRRRIDGIAPSDVGLGLTVSEPYPAAAAVVGPLRRQAHSRLFATERSTVQRLLAPSRY
jgi:hypothetical protein